MEMVKELAWHEIVEVIGSIYDEKILFFLTSVYL